MRHELIDRYIYNVTKSLPWREKKDITKRLETEIDQKIVAANLGDNPTNEQITNILKDFGDSTDVAQHYSKIGNRALIPQPYYGYYNVDLKLSLLVAAITIIAISVLFNMFVYTPNSLVTPVLDTLTDLLLAGFSIFSIYTLTFSLITNRRTGKKLGAYIEGLKPEPKQGNRISRAEIYFQVVFSAIFFSLFAYSTDLLELNFAGMLFKAGYIVNQLIPIIVVYFLTVLNIATKEVDRRYTNGVLATTIIHNIALVGLVYVILVMDNAISMNFKNALKRFVPMNDMTIFIIDNIGMVIFFIIVLIAAVDVIFSAYKHHNDNVHIQQMMASKPIAPPPVTEPPIIAEEPPVNTTPVEAPIIIEEPNSETKVLNKDEISRELSELEPVIVDENPNSETLVIPKAEIEGELHAVNMPNIDDYLEINKDKDNQL